MTSQRRVDLQIVEHTRRLEEYRNHKQALPALPKISWKRGRSKTSMPWYWRSLRCYPHELSVLEVGTSLGIATFHFAGQPSVSRVLGVDRPRARTPARRRV